MPAHGNVSSIRFPNAARFHLGRDEAEAIVAAMEERGGKSWYETARRAGVSERDCATIGGAFVYPGFRLAS